MRHALGLIVLPVLLLAILGMARAPQPSRGEPAREVTFLGTGAAWPVPRLGCACQTCEKAKTTSPQTRRMRSALKIGRDDFLLVDMGMDIYRQLIPMAQPRPRAILLTHTHLDHAGGATEFAPLVRKVPIPLYSSPAVWAELKGTARWVEQSFAFPSQPGPWTVGPYVVRTFALEHGTACVGFRVDSGGHSLAYVCDVDRVPAASLSALQGLDVMILDGAAALDAAEEGAEVARHIGPDAVRALLAATRPRRVIFTHIGHGASWHENTAQRAARRYGAEVAYDGWSIAF